jgi:hypothetical protein
MEGDMKVAILLKRMFQLIYSDFEYHAYYLWRKVKGQHADCLMESWGEVGGEFAQWDDANPAWKVIRLDSISQARLDDMW